ncbi:MAG: PQQ-dependent dehydrogenase, methanol/ethanol family [Acidobacteriota bacterium]
MAGLLSWLVTSSVAQPTSRKVDGALLRRAPAEEWLGYGRDQAETHFSPLKQIDATNVARLGLAFAGDTDAPAGNIQATPIVANGVMYTSLPWGVLYAADARTGKFKWRWDPELPRTGPDRPGFCCGAVNRGMAIYNGKVYASLIFGRLVALDAETGKLVWSAQTTDTNTDMTITSAVRIAKGKVIVGTAGAEFNVRGYFSAYDAETGKMAWRFYTTPGDPSKPFEHAELKEAAKTWKGTDWSVVKGGGTVWDGMAYDADADLLYIGTGNGSPWNRQFRSPGGGDNLFLCSILAVKPDTGKLAWYYQTTPGESWDYTSVQSLILADLNIKGRNRKVIMQAPKNGFFYVLDRVTGEFISAEPYSEVTWAKGIDPKTGRPIENPGVRFENGTTVELSPGSGGGHNWQPMAFSPATGLVYIPGANNSRMYHSTPDFVPAKGKQITGVDMNNFAEGLSPAGARITNKGNFLKAWDPITQSARWSVPVAGGFSGGVMATAGNLVFAPSNDKLTAYSADKGEKVWEATLAPGVATPMTYQLDGKQYIGVVAGRGSTQAPTRFYSFVLDGAAPMPELPKPPAKGAAKGK